jgi:glycosyltransferase involved in cell wall biosynthesis
MDINEPALPARMILIDHCACIGGAQLSLSALAECLVAEGIIVKSGFPRPGSFFPLIVTRSPQGCFSMVVNIFYFLTISITNHQMVWYCNSVLDRIQCLLINPNNIVLHIRDSPKKWHLLIMRMLRSSLNVVSSSYMERLVSTNAPYAKPLTMIPNIIIGQKSKSPGSCPLDEFRILMVANFAPWKNHHLALDAFQLLLSNGEKVTLTIWGTDPLNENKEYSEQIRTRIKKFPINTVELIEGKLIGEEDYQKYHCLLHPAKGEPFGRVLAEAMGNGLPIVGHNSGNTSEFLQKYKGGKIINSDLPEGVAQALLEIILDWRKFHDAARVYGEMVLKDFSGPKAIHCLKMGLALRKLGLASNKLDVVKEHG